MKVTEKVFVAIDYSLSLDDGETIDSSKKGEPLGFLMGGGQVINGLETNLMGMETGESKKFTVEAEDAYGPVNPEMVQDVSKDQFPKDMEITPGMTFEAQAPHGLVLVKVEKVNGDTITIDLNHPMAGKRLTFDVTVSEVREATPEELAGPTSGCGGCDCDSEGTDACSPDNCSTGCGCS